MDERAEKLSPKIARQIFESYFRDLMSPEELARALVVFDAISDHNERSVAIQFLAATSTEKLAEVLDAYEIFIGPEGYLHLIPDEVTRAVEVKRFGDYIYLNVIAEGDAMKLFEQRRRVEIPTVFDNMRPDLSGASPN